MPRFKDLSYRFKLFLTYALIVSLPLSILSWMYFHSSREFVSEFARQNLYSIVKQNNEIMDAELAQVEESSLAIIADQTLYEQYLHANPADEYSMISMEKKVSRTLNTYFTDLGQIYSIHLITSYSNIGPTGASAFIPYSNFNQTALYRAALQGEGAMEWVPTFSFDQMFKQDIRRSKPPEYVRLLAGARLLKLFNINNGEVVELQGKAELPVLAVVYRPEIYHSRFANTLPSAGASFFVVSPAGQPVAGTSMEHEMAGIDLAWLDEMTEMKSGTLTVTQDGKPLIVCFDTSKVTGWISGVTISPEAMVAAFLPEIKSYTFYLAIILLFISLLLAYVFANSITRPIHQLLQAIKKTSEGEFDTRIPVESYNEMGLLIHKFNQMNVKINNLIEENYKVKLREKETKIMSLNIQLNPHFMYNTLNIMNWTALENDQKELSRMIVSLSSMLQYTSENSQDIGDLAQDLNWLKHYIYITNQRFEDRFTVNYCLAPELYAYQVPKLFLQPFIENAIVHAFSRLHSGGRITIRGWMADGERFFTVEDNGTGIAPDKLEELAKLEGESIGIRNVDKRIKLIYGDGYGVTLTSVEGQGTTVTINLPVSNV
ncbi:sensor histidine kinase [Paenibacillus sp. JNUCC31]|uniref:cache domain-containing sensor histidine kinase n=1 Tax=Paenibacillus sp. JNUCC-31 TaxID=2777983 RepID=UPI00177CF2F0|nr:sensor histidine kinase [Paenibacillus sp. JNUCC-31]QOS77118.1 sensor histidine kinase [Paenibacillus sp. JNUCC-31]